MDRAWSEFRPCIHSKKWCRPFFVNALYISVVYTWRLYSILKKKFVPHKEFRMALVEGLTRSFVPTAESRVNLSGSGPSHTLSDRLRYDNLDHKPIAIPNPRKCVVCKKSARIQCEKCRKTLHNNGICFQDYHDPRLKDCNPRARRGRPGDRVL